jgi:dihydrolipoamide dehydrogenase
MPDTSLAVIGAGPGGYAAAFLAADLGIDVTLIDPEANPGGVCLYRGCIPSKALLHVADVVAGARQAAAWGVEFGDPTIRLERLRAWKDGVVSRLTGGLGQLSTQRKVRYVRGRAAFADASTLSVAVEGGGENRLTFEHAIVAIGSSPTRIPGVSIDSPLVMDSTTALEVPEIPESLLVVGGGYIGLELGTVYATLGSRVTVVEMTPGLLPGVDRDLVNVLARRIQTLVHAVLLETKVLEVKAERRGVTVRFEGAAGQQTQSFARVLVAVGRRPNRMPGIEQTRVAVDRRGFIGVDAQRRTSEPHIFAIGDVAGEPMLAHKASHEGRVAVEAIAGRAAAFEPRAIPAVVFTDPEIAWCGLTETEAASQQREVKVSRFPWGASGRAITLDRPEGVTKLVLDPRSERVLGMGIVGAGAGELIAEGVLAIEMGATAEDVAHSIHAHPTLSETVMESAEAFFGQATHIYRPRRS